MHHLILLGGLQVQAQRNHSTLVIAEKRHERKRCRVQQSPLSQPLPRRLPTTPAMTTCGRHTNNGVNQTRCSFLTTPNAHIPPPPEGRPASSDASVAPHLPPQAPRRGRASPPGDPLPPCGRSPGHSVKLTVPRDYQTRRLSQTTHRNGGVGSECKTNPKIKVNVICAFIVSSEFLYSCAKKKNVGGRRIFFVLGTPYNRRRD